MKFVNALLSAVSSSACGAVILALINGRLTAASAVIALGLGALVGAAALCWRPAAPAQSAEQPDPTARPLSAWDWAAIALFSLFSLRAFLWLIFWNGNELMVLSPNNLGDMSLHLTYIRQLAGGAQFWPENPIYANATLTYPLGIDLFNSLLCLVNVDIGRGLIWVGLAGCLVSGIALWHWGRAFALLGFLGNGGLLAWVFYWNGLRDHGWQFLHSDLLADFQTEAAWKSIFLALFVTQRGMLFAVPAGLALLLCWRRRFFENRPGTLPRWSEVLLYSSMPLFHFHTFLFLSFTLGIWVLILPTQRRALLTLIGTAFVLATALVWLVTGHLKGTSMLGWLPGWMQGDQNPIAFWGLNFGILPLLVGMLCVRLMRKQNAHWAAASTLPALGIFFICCFVKFAPWEWDNTKLMIWSYLVILPPLWDQLISHWPPPLRALCCLLLFGSGILSTLGGIDSSHKGHPIAQRAELAAVQSSIQALPVDARFAAAPAYNHPLLLSGRKLAMGFEGHVWSHGYDFASRKAQLDTLMNGAEGWAQIAAELNVRYLFWGDAEAAAYPDSSQPWIQSAALVASSPWGSIYDLSAPPPAPAPASEP